MLDSRAIGVVIGLAGAYIALSLVVLCVVEMISSALSRRARFLRDAIINMLGRDLGSRVLSNALVSSLGFTRSSGRAIGLPSYVPSTYLARALFMEIPNGKERDDQAAVAVKDLISAVVGDPSVSLEEAERRLAAWFDSAMDRLSGAFKRNTQRFSLAVATVLVLVGNVDTIRLARTLWSDAGARERAVVLSKSEIEVCEADGSSPECREFLGELVKGDTLPLGWDLEAVRGLDLQGVFLMILGLGLTALAVSRGAPFWFDVLRRFSSGLVSSGPPPPPAPAAPPPGPAVSVKVEERAEVA